MDFRCPLCGADLGKRRITQAIVARMEIDCSQCKGAIILNVHRAEEIAVLLSFGAVIALAACAYWSQSRTLALAMFGVAMLGSLSLPVLERTYLRSWPRYAPNARRHPLRP